MNQQSYEDYCKGRHTTSRRKISKIMDNSSPTERFFNRYPSNPENRAELCEQRKAAAAFKQEGSTSSIDEDIGMWEKLSTEAKEEADKFRDLERQAQDDNWRYKLPSQLLQKHNFNVNILRSEIQIHRMFAEELYQRCESLALEAMKRCDEYEWKSERQAKNMSRARRAGTIVGEIGSGAIGGADLGTIPIVASAVAHGFAKGLNGVHNRKEAYEEMNQAREYLHSAGYSPAFLCIHF